MNKPVDIKIDVRLPKDHKAVSAHITETGHVVFRDATGRTVEPLSTMHTVSYKRQKGPKVQSSQTSVGIGATVGGLEELCKYESVISIDTNSKVINGKKVSVACFLRCKFHNEGDGNFRVKADEHVNFYEFHNVTGNPELLAILKVSQDILRVHGTPNIAFITDTELGNHHGYISRALPIYGDALLPDGFNIIYASADTGHHALNQLIKFCDKQATGFFEALERGELPLQEFLKLHGCGETEYRYFARDGFVIDNPIVKQSFEIHQGTTVALYGIRD